MTDRNMPLECPPSNDASEALAHLQRALEIADRAGLPPLVAARVQEAIDACEIETRGTAAIGDVPQVDLD
jgi:hypothetical protein